MKDRVIVDPIYGYIILKEDIIKRLVDTKFFQRLRRIYQMGNSFFVFPSAVHTRFSHCLGVYELARQICEKLLISKREQLLLMVSALLHDIGHGPFSHLYDSLVNGVHEVRGAYIIANDPEISGILNEVDKEFVNDVCSVLTKDKKFSLLESILSSQLDIDRLDYLKRDAYFAAVKTGDIDSTKLINSLTVHDGKLCFKESAVYAIENYLISRYHMYMQVYLHPSVIGRDFNLLEIFKDLESVQDPLLKKVLKSPNNPDLNLFLNLDDAYFLTYFKQLSGSNLPVAKLTREFIYRQNWQPKEFTDKNVNARVWELKKQIYDFQKEPILLLTQDKQIVKLQDYSDFVANLAKRAKVVKQYTWNK